LPLDASREFLVLHDNRAELVVARVKRRARCARAGRSAGGFTPPCPAWRLRFSPSTNPEAPIWRFTG